MQNTTFIRQTQIKFKVIEIQKKKETNKTLAHQ